MMVVSVLSSSEQRRVDNDSRERQDSDEDDEGRKSFDSVSQDELEIPLLNSNLNKKRRQRTNSIRYCMERKDEDRSTYFSSGDRNMSPSESTRDKQQQGGGNVINREIDGRQAWLILACIFISNATTLGALKVYGLIFEEIVNQKYYTRQEASWPISTASTIQNLAGLLTPMLALKISWRSIEIIQTLLFVLANVGAFYSRSLAIDILCLGIVQGVAFSIRYNMNVVVNNEYFVKYQATAIGISLAGSSCGVFALKPIISYVLDISNHQFRNAYLVLGMIMSINIIFNLFIRKPRIVIRSGSPDSRASFHMNNDDDDDDDDNDDNDHGNENDDQDETDRINSSMLLSSLIELCKNPSIHCIWISQTIYFYISRTYTIFIVDYGVDSGFDIQDSRSLLTFWVYGEVIGRLLLGSFIDSKVLKLKWNMILVNLLVALNGYFLLFAPSIFKLDSSGKDTDDSNLQSYMFWFFGMSIALTAAFSSLINIMMIPFGQEYLGKKNVPWAFAMSSIVTSVFLLFRPLLIGLSRDNYKSYDLLIFVMSTGPFVFGLLFLLAEPFLKRQRYAIHATRGNIINRV